MMVFSIPLNHLRARLIADPHLLKTNVDVIPAKKLETLETCDVGAMPYVLKYSYAANAFTKVYLPYVESEGIRRLRLHMKAAKAQLSILSGWNSSGASMTGGLEVEK